jgi:quaternary ammonium compound-resistance protein SugE
MACGPAPGPRTSGAVPGQRQNGACGGCRVLVRALGRSEGFSRLVPSLVFGVALVLSMVGLAYAMRDLPVGTAYAVWVGIGAVLTVVIAMVTGEESVSVVKLLLLAGIVGCVVGLKVLH